MSAETQLKASEGNVGGVRGIGGIEDIRDTTEIGNKPCAARR